MASDNQLSIYSGPSEALATTAPPENTQPAYFSSLSAEERELIRAGTAKLRRKDRQQIAVLQEHVQRLEKERLDALARRHAAKSDGRTPSRTLTPVPLLLLRQHGVEHHPRTEVHCENCLRERQTMHLFLLYGTVGFQLQVLGRDHVGIKRVTWSCVTSRLCFCDHETRIVGPGRTECRALDL